MSAKSQAPVPDPRGDPVPSEKLEREKGADDGVPLKDGKKPEIEIERAEAGVETSEAGPGVVETLLPPD